MNKILLLFLLTSIAQVSISQDFGDTIVVQSFTYDNDSRDIMVDFPDDPNLTYEKIILRYNMRCKDGNISTGTDRNLGCGEWDFSNNTYLVDSTDLEIVIDQVTSHFLTNWDDASLSYSETPIYDYYREETQEVTITNTVIEDDVLIGANTESLDIIMATDKLAGKSQFLYRSDELIAAGLEEGAIRGLSLDLLDNAGEANFLRVKIKNTSLNDMDGEIELDGFTEVYYNNADLLANESNRLQFHTPFEWDGTSNILVEFNFSNHIGSLNPSNIAGETTSENLGLINSNGSEFLLSSNAYIESKDYRGIGGDTNRTIEAWVKGDVVRNGEICSWGSLTTGSGAKWTFRMLSTGEIRVEIQGTGTVSTTKINDGQWHHVVCVLDGDNASDIRFYIDGELDSNSVTGNGVINTDIADGINVRVNRGTNNRYFDGEIDDVRIWDTNLSGETIKNWMRRDIDSSHPNYSNLQLHYEFEGSGLDIIDSSPNGRDGNLIGRDYRTSFSDGNGLFKDFIATNNRPSITFSQGLYQVNTTTNVVERPFTKSNQIFVSTNTIVPGDDNIAKDDEIISSDPTQLWLAEENIFDPATGALIETRTLNPDNTLEVTQLDYTRRWPMFNELVSFVTPYGIGLDLGLEGVSWYFDMSDYVSILKGKKRMLMTLGGQNQEDMDLDFLFIVGEPARDVIKYEQLWQGTNRIGNATIADLRNDVKIAPVTTSIPSNADTYKVLSTITGHGSEGEFSQNGGTINHNISVNQNLITQWRITEECSENPISPQGGTWVFDREGWCPGQRSLIKQHNLESIVAPGEEFEFDYGISTPPVSTGDYRYHMSHQLIAYGAPNRNLDAAVIEVIAPNNSVQYTRVGESCGDPQIRIQNTGGFELTNLTIEYWLNDAFEKQTFQWTGNLSFMESEVVTIPSSREFWMDFQENNNEFHVNLKFPNHDIDEYSLNNSFTTSFNKPDLLPKNISVRVNTNNFPQENSYQLFDASGNVIGSNDLNSANFTTIDEYELEEGCYKLVFFDSGDDGLVWWANAAQGTGSVSILDDNGQSLVNFETDFGGKFEYTFSTSFTVSAEELEFLSSLKLYPNPTVDFITLEGKELSSAQLSLTNISGQKIKSINLQNAQNEVTIDTGALESGIYFITIVKDDLKTTRKFIKK